MYETLKMMKSVLTGKEGSLDEKELIKEYKDNLSPNILAHFYVDNFGFILTIRNSYPLLLDEDVASFCLQELDKALINYDFNRNIKFITYFSNCFYRRLSCENRTLKKRKNIVNFNTDIIDNAKSFDDFEDLDLIMDQYGLNKKEKLQSKLKLFGYTFKEIAKLTNFSNVSVYKRNQAIKQKILKVNV